MSHERGLGAVTSRSSGRGTPLVATWSRWILSSAAVALGFTAALAACLAFVHATRTIESFQVTIAVAAALASLVLLFLLRAEEARLARELRTARTGTPALRNMVAGRRLDLPFFARFFSTKIGTAAVLLAGGDRSGAVAALSAGSRAMQGGRLNELRRLVELDVERARGTPEALKHVIAGLRGAAPIGNREADLYALHVLAKAILEQGAADVALEVVEELARTADDEKRLYSVWLRAWFEFDDEGAGQGGTVRWPPLSDGEVRMAALLARAHGAEKLVEKLEERVPAIARISPEE